MRKIKEVLRLKYACGLSHERIAASCGISQSSVSKYLQRAQAEGLAWPLPDDLTDDVLDARLFRVSPVPIPREGPTKPLPDFAEVHEELRTHRRLNLTLEQLWQEYRECHPDGYAYSRFCDHYRRWRRTLDPVMRQTHPPGEKLFIDYTDGLFVINPFSGERLPTDLFVATWGASCLTYAEATFTQSLPAWMGSHVRAFDYFGCVPQVLVPDNLKSGVTRACRYEPDLNPTYADLAAHYGVAVIPARPYHPRDKAKVENGVLVAKRWILSALRHRSFYSLEDLNKAIRELLEKLNTRLMRKLKKSRRDLFETLDRPAARPLPQDPYVFAEWKKAGVNIDYHIEIDHHYYSVPFRYVRQEVEVRLTATTLEVFKSGSRIAAHPRSYTQHAHTTLRDHMPSAHQNHLDWNPSRLIRWAETIGPCTGKLVGTIIADKPHPELGYRSSLGVMRLSRSYPKERMEAAARRALFYRTCSFRSMKSILERGLDQVPLPASDTTVSAPVVIVHDNIRGADYFLSHERKDIP
jgi:transposase